MIFFKENLTNLQGVTEPQFWAFSQISHVFYVFNGSIIITSV